MELFVGQMAEATKTFSQADFDRFAALSGDDNPIHVDPVFSAQTHFGRTVCHGMLLYSTICQVLGQRLPGPGAIQWDQSLMFPTPTFTGEEMDIELKVLETRPKEGTAVLETTISHQDGQFACHGQTTVGLTGRLPGEITSAKPIDKGETVQAFKGLKLDQKTSTTRVFTEKDLVEYADLTGDNNPIFTEKGYAREFGLEDRMIPGGLLGGLFSYLLGTELPGRGTNWLKQRLIFLRPAYPGQAITAEVQISRLRADKELVNLGTNCFNTFGEIICTGEALVLVKDLLFTA